MDQSTFLSSLQTALDAANQDSIGRADLQDSLGIPDRQLGELLEKSVDLGFVIGAEVAEVRGPVRAISLTHNGRRIARDSLVNHSTYLGYDIVSRPVIAVGSSSGHVFEVARRGRPVFELTFNVTYTAATKLGAAPDDSAYQMGTSFVRGLLALEAFPPGESRVVTIDSTTEIASGHLAAGELERHLLLALREMMRAESRSNEIPYLDVEGVALVLEIETELVAETLVRLNVLEQVESNAATFGRPMQAGACRITKQGLQRIDTEAQFAGHPAQAPTDQGPTDNAIQRRPRVFISYSHDSQAHERVVLSLANRLRTMGVNVDIDQYNPAPAEGWPRWMADILDDWADLVLVVCTETYYRRAMGRETDGRGLGATYEGTLINQQIFNAGGRNRKFLPVLMRPSDTDHIPTFLTAYTRYDISTDDGFNSLYRAITEQPQIVPPPLGDLVPMPPAEITTWSPQINPPPWHIDICFLWQSNGEQSRYLTSWAPSEGFFVADDLTDVMAATGSMLTPSDLTIVSGIAIAHLPGHSLHIEFTRPAGKVTALLHTPDDEYEPDEIGGGARQYVAWNLKRLPDLPDR